MHRTRRIYQGTACADIQNGRQLISRGALSSDRPRLFSIPIAQQDGANHYAASPMICHCVMSYAELRSSKITQNYAVV